jgi:hypothetical protein
MKNRPRPLLARAIVAAIPLLAAPAFAQQPPPPAVPEAAPPPGAPPPAPPLPATLGAPAEAGTPAPAEPIDLGALGIQDDSQASRANEHPLLIYGFADFTYVVPLFPRDSYLGASLPTNQQFVMGNFNLYLAKQLSERIRALGEVRFLYLPNGQVASGAFTSTTVGDPADVYRDIRWGGILVERLHVEYDLLPWLTLRGGEFLTPFGIWNVDHGTPTLIGIRRPYIIGQSVFPERQTGLELIGRHFVREIGVEWHLTLSNGRGPIDETRDLDTNKAVGGRVVLEWKRDFALRLGFSFYRGLYTNRTPASFDATAMKASSTILERYTEQALAGDLSVDAAHVVFRGEIVAGDRKYDDNFRGLGPTFTPDNRQWGYYALLGYRLPHGVLPYVLGEYFKFPQVPIYSVIDVVHAFQAGINYQLHPSLIIKLEYSYATLPGSSYKAVSDTPYKTIETQVSWVF